MKLVHILLPIIKHLTHLDDLEDHVFDGHVSVDNKYYEVFAFLLLFYLCLFGFV